MSKQSRKALRDQVNFNQTVIEQYDSRIADINQAHFLAEAALRDAQANLAVIEAARIDIYSHRKTLMDETERIRATLSSVPPWIISALPIELLREIFLNVLASNYVPFSGQSNWARHKAEMSAPFVLASVCTRWRAVALDTPLLWRFICVNSGTTRACVRLLVQRSGTAPITVAFFSPDESSLDILLKNTDRWKQLFWVLKDDVNTILSVLRRPFSTLEDVLVIRAGLDQPGITYSHPHPHILPFSPALSVFQTNVPNLILTAPCNMPKLQFVEVTFTSMPLAQIHASLESIPSVNRLALSFDKIPAHNGSMTRPVVMRNLQSLTVLTLSERLRISDILHAPSLTDLCASSFLLKTDEVLIAACSKTLESLEVVHFNPVNADFLDIIRPLVELQCISFLSGTVLMDDFFDALKDDPTCLPKLQNMAFKNNAELRGDGLTRLLRSRNSTEASSPARLTDVELTSSSVPDWIKAQVAHILA